MTMCDRNFNKICLKSTAERSDFFDEILHLQSFRKFYFYGQQNKGKTFRTLHRYENSEVLF